MISGTQGTAARLFVFETDGFTKQSPAACSGSSCGWFFFFYITLTVFLDLPALKEVPMMVVALNVYIFYYWFFFFPQQARKDLEQKRQREERRIKAILQDSPPPPWSPPNKTIPFRKWHLKCNITPLEYLWVVCYILTCEFCTVCCIKSMFLYIVDDSC